MFNFAYKSEVGAVYLAAAAAASFPFLPRKALLVAVPLWVVASRVVAGGARNRARPPTAAMASPQSSIQMSQDMKIEDRPIAVVTGTNSGIGYETAVELAAEGYVVVVTCRSAVLALQTAERIQHEAERRQEADPSYYSNAPRKVIVDGQMPLECDDFKSIRTFVQWFSQHYGHRNVQVLVNNAGGMKRDLTFSTFNASLEHHTAVNFLGPLLLTELMLPLLEDNAGRVVYVSSEAHRFPQMALDGFLNGGRLGSSSSKGSLHGRLFEAVTGVNKGAASAEGLLAGDSLWMAYVRYGTSKLLNTYHAHHVARRYRHKDLGTPGRVHVCSLHPGCVTTNFSRDLLQWNVLNAIFQVGGLLFLKNWREGAQTTLHCAMCPLEDLELVAPPGAAAEAKRTDVDMDPFVVSPYFVECANKSDTGMLSVGWDVEEAEKIIAWGKAQVGLSH